MTHFLHDILNEPAQLAGALRHTLGEGRAALERAAQALRDSRHVYLTGIGSSWHAGMAMQSIFNRAGFPAGLHDASELLHFVALPAGSALVILSRSGRSVEVVRLLDKARLSGARIIGVTNTPDSPLGQAAEVSITLNAAFDHMVSVSMYSALALAGGLLAAAVTSGIDPGLEGRLAGALRAAGEAIPDWQRRINASDWLAPGAPAYFLARGGSLASCHETRLLWEEAAKAPASALMTGCFRHGPQEIAGAGLRIGMWLDGERLRDQDLALARDLRRLGAAVMLIGHGAPEAAADLVLPLPDIDPAWQFAVDIVPAQLAAELLSHRRGVDCDGFRTCPYIIEDEGGLGSGTG